MERTKYILILGLALLVLLSVSLLTGDAPRLEGVSGEYSFEGKKKRELFRKADEELAKYESDSSDERRLVALAGVMELYNYMLYTGNVSIDHYYDRMKTVLLPGMRDNLKSKESYLREMRRFRRRIRNTGARYLKYEISFPVISHEDTSPASAVLEITRYSDAGEEKVQKHFEQFEGTWYYKTSNAR